MGRQRKAISVPASLKPLLERPADWPANHAWRVFAAACRASGAVAWAARLETPGGEMSWLSGRTPSRPGVIQSECVDALEAVLRKIPHGDAVEVVAPTSLRYLVEGAEFPEGTPERNLSAIAGRRLVWARYALGELDGPVAQCLAKAYGELAPLRWPGESALGNRYVVYADGGCTPHACASAWMLRKSGETLTEHAWCQPGALEPDAVRLAEFVAAVSGLAAVPPGSVVAVVTDHADVTDFGVRGVPAFRPSRSMIPILEELRQLAAQRQVTWYWAARDETDGQRRCQRLIDRQLRAADAWRRFQRTCVAAGLRRVFVPSFDRWLAPREPLVDQPGEHWSATFERRDRYLAAGATSSRVYVRQVPLQRAPGMSLSTAFARSRAGRWCDDLQPHPSQANAAAVFLGYLRNCFPLQLLLYEPDLAVLVQARPGATLDDVLEAGAQVHEVALE
jgi:hypothetical protein